MVPVYLLSVIKPQSRNFWQQRVLLAEFRSELSSYHLMSTALRLTPSWSVAAHTHHPCALGAEAASLCLWG